MASSDESTIAARRARVSSARLACRDVAQDTGEYRSLLGVNGRNRQLHGKLGAIRSHRRDLDDLPEQRPFPGRKVARQTGRVRIALTPAG